MGALADFAAARRRSGDGAAATAVEKRCSALKRGLFLAWLHARHRAHTRTRLGATAA